SAKNYGGTYGAVFENIGSAGYFSSGKICGGCKVDYIYHNPAGLAQNTRINIGSTYAKLFNEIDGIKEHDIFIIFPYKKIVSGILYYNFNVDDIRGYNDNAQFTGNYSAKSQALLANVGYNINDKLDLGLRVSYYQQKIREYKLDNYTLSLGAKYEFNKLIIDCFAENLFSTKSSGRKTKEKLPVKIDISTNYYVLDDLIIGVALECEENYGQDYRAGLKYAVFRDIYLNAGYINSSKIPTVGFSAKIMNIKFQYGLSKHKDLDLTHKFSLGYEF
ncbi:MAG TPA: hypothetical protein PLJ38_09980, partial [bacterium]|nr:hypothetical protein [bacterium]